MRQAGLTARQHGILADRPLCLRVHGFVCADWARVMTLSLGDDSVSKFLFSLFIIFAYFFSSLTISEVFEDYISDDKIKYVANRLLFISAIIIPLLTIIFLFNLN